MVQHESGAARFFAELARLQQERVANGFRLSGDDVAMAAERVLIGNDPLHATRSHGHVVVGWRCRACGRIAR